MSSTTSITRLPDPDGQPSRMFRRGDTVLRPAGPWTPTVHALLRHLEQAGFTGAPRVVGDGYDDQGREVVTFIEGTFVHPHAWSFRAPCLARPWNDWAPSSPHCHLGGQV